MAAWEHREVGGNTMFYMSSYRVSFACVSQGLAIKIIGQGLQAMTTLKCGKKSTQKRTI